MKLSCTSVSNPWLYGCTWIVVGTTHCSNADHKSRDWFPCWVRISSCVFPFHFLLPNVEHGPNGGEYERFTALQTARWPRSFAHSWPKVSSFESLLRHIFAIYVYPARRESSKAPNQSKTPIKRYYWTHSHDVTISAFIWHLRKLIFYISLTRTLKIHVKTLVGPKSEKKERLKVGIKHPDNLIGSFYFCMCTN